MIIVIVIIFIFIVIHSHLQHCHHQPLRKSSNFYISPLPPRSPSLQQNTPIKGELFFVGPSLIIEFWIVL